MSASQSFADLLAGQGHSAEAIRVFLSSSYAAGLSDEERGIPTPQPIPASMPFVVSLERQGHSPEVINTFLSSSYAAGLTDEERGIPVSTAAPVDTQPTFGFGVSQPNPALGSGVYQTFSPLNGPAVYSGGDTEETGAPIPNADPLINGVQYRSIAGFANNSPDPDQAMNLELAHLRRFSVAPVNHPQYGWIALDDRRFAEAHPEMASSSIFDFGPFILGGGLALLSAGFGAAAVAGAAETAGAGFTAGIDFLPEAFEMIGGGSGVLSGGGVVEGGAVLSEFSAGIDFLPDATEMIGGGQGVFSGGTIVESGAALTEIGFNPFTAGTDFLPDATEMIGGGQGVLSGGTMIGSGASVGSIGSTSILGRSVADLGTRLVSGVTAGAAAIGSRIAAAALTTPPRARSSLVPAPVPAAPAFELPDGNLGLAVLALAAVGFFVLKG